MSNKLVCASTGIISGLTISYGINKVNYKIGGDSGSPLIERIKDSIAFPKTVIGNFTMMTITIGSALAIKKIAYNMGVLLCANKKISPCFKFAGVCGLKTLTIFVGINAIYNATWYCDGCYRGRYPSMD